MEVKKHRCSYVDIAKCILISLLVIHHIIDVGVNNLGIDNSVLNFVKSIQRSVILCYFMPSFFFITGMCSNFKRNSKDFVVSQIKTLLLPALTFIFLFNLFPFDLRSTVRAIYQFLKFGYGCWFMLALFSAKLFYFFVSSFISSKMVLLFVFGILSFGGVALNQSDIFPNYFALRQTLDLTIFLVIGNLYGKTVNKKYIFTLSFVLFAILLTIYGLLGLKVPYVTFGFGTTILDWPTHIILSLTGTIIILYLSEIIRKESMLEYIGKNSLFIYMFQGECLPFLMKVYLHNFNNDGVLDSVIMIFFVFTNTIAVGILASYIFNTKYLKYTVGKF